MELEYEGPVLEILSVLEREGLLREADPFMMRYLREKINDIICNTSGDNSSDYEVGYQEGREKGYQEGRDDVWQEYRDNLRGIRNYVEDLLD